MEAADSMRAARSEAADNAHTREPGPLPRPFPAWAASLATAAFAAALHARSVHNGLTNWDDPEYVTGNPIAAQGLRGVLSAFTTPFDGAWYPLTQVVYSLIHAVAGPSAWAHHLVQVLVFAGAAALAPLALGAFGVPRLPALIASLLWVAHPFRPESVAWAANLKDALSVLFVFGAFALYRAGRRAGAAVAFALGLLAKSMVFPVALLIPLLEWSRGRRIPAALRAGLPWLLPAVAIAITTALLHLGAPEAVNRSRPGGSLIGAVPTVLWLPWWYLGRVLLPLGSRALYAFEPVGWSDPRLLLAAGLWFGLLAFLATRTAERRRPWMLGVAAWLAPLAAVTGLAPLGFFVAERYTLLPSLALAGGLAVLLPGMARSAAMRRGGQVAVAALLLALATASFVRQAEWTGAVELWEANRRLAPGMWAVHFNLAGAYGGQERWEEAIAALEEARRLKPEIRQIPRDLFFARAAQAGMPLPRIEHHVDVIRGQEHRGEALVAAGAAVLAEGYPGPARSLLESALRRGNSARAHALLSKAWLEERNLDKAVAHAQAAIGLDRSLDELRVELTVALARTGRHREAISLSATPSRDPRVDALLRGARGFALFQSGEAEEAEQLLEKAQRDLAALGYDAAGQRR